jgi:hypothetical protein
MSSRDIKRRSLAPLSLAAICVLVTACQDYAARRDTIAFHAGEAVAYNKAVHTIDPWPAASRRTDLDFDGERAVRVMERYESGAAGVAAASVSVPVPMPMPAAGPPK